MTTGSDNPGLPGALPTDLSALGATTEFFSARPTREPAPEAAFAFRSNGVSGVDVRVVSAFAREALNELYEAVIELASSDPAIDFGALLGERGALDITRGPRTRHVCGMVRRVERLDSWGGQRRAKIVMVPAMWALSKRVDSRIYQQLDTIEVLKSVFSDAGLDAPAVETRREYHKREYCVQYRESDLAFVSRLLEEEGIVLYFRHDGDAETVVLTDSASYALCPTLDRRAVPFAPPQSEAASVEVVQRLDVAKELRQTGFTGRDYDFTRPLATLDMTRAQPRGDQGPRASYEFPARFTPGPYDEGSLTYGAHDGARRAEVRQGDEHALENVGAGTGNVTGFMPGRVFQLLGHEHADLDQKYLITAVEHHLRAPEVLLSEHADEKASRGVDRYRNSFHCIPADVAYLPHRKTPRPMVLASQTAVVTGKGDEEITVDAHGRIKVQFHWDRQGQHDDKSSCWIRVAQNWAGGGWGFMFIPRVGMEVVVAFLEGDPDRPLVTGCVYNGVNRPPYELPAEKTKSTIKSTSSPGGNGFNELRFEDLKGSEEIYIHAQKDLNETINHDHSVTVGNNQSIYIKGHQYLTIEGKGEKPNGMPGPGHGVKVNGEYSIDASGDIHIQSGANIYEEAAVNHHIKATSVYLKSDDVVQISTPRFNVTATDKIILRVGGSAISISNSGILIKSSANVKIDTVDLKMSGSASAGLTSSGVTDVSGTPLQLNGPGLFAGRVTESAPATITTGAALVLVGGATFPYPVTKIQDGTILVGPHITIKPSTGRYKDFQAKVLRDLGVMSSTPAGQQRLENIQNNPKGHNVSIREFSADEEKEWGKNNSLCYPGANVGDDNALHYEGNKAVSGPGTDSDLAYNPDIVDGPKGHPEPTDATLFHEMGHAEHNAYGTNRQWEGTGDGWENREEYQTIEQGTNDPRDSYQVEGVPRSPTENEYLGDRGYPYRRTDHGSGYANQDGTPIKP